MRDGDTREKTAIVVLGMHRSGTSALSRSLSFYGYRQPDDLVPPAVDNPQGFWEPLGSVRLNDRILSAMGMSWDRVGPVVVGEQGPAESWRTVMAELKQHYLGEAIAVLRASYGDGPAIVLKDPRITALIPFWAAAIEAAGYRARYVMTYRNPLEVAASLEARNQMTRQHALQLWQHHILAALALERQGKLDAVIAYADLLADPRRVLDPVVERLGGPPEGLDAERAAALRDFLSPAERHHSLPAAAPSDVPNVPRLVQETWTLLTAWGDMPADERSGAVAELTAFYEDALLFTGSVHAVDPAQLAPR